MHKLFTTLVLLIALFIALPPKAHCTEKLIFAGLGSLNSDIAYSVLQEAYSALGIDIERKNYPIIRALHSANKGVVDGEIFRTGGIEQDHKGLIAIPIPVNHIELMVLTKDKNLKITDWTSLKPYRIGIYKGVIHTKKKTTEAGCDKVFEVESNAQILKMIEIDRLDVGLIAKIAGKTILTTKKDYSVIMLSPPLERFPVYHYLNKKHAYLVPQIAAELKKMQNKGRIELIRNKILENNFKY